jgi:ferric-dicitrate binding protein FerR (iron transport regulator)
VYANELVTKVLGTSFVVKAYPYQKNVQVLVRTGKVSVYRLETAKSLNITDNKELDGVVISPNQQIVYERQEAEFKKSIVQQPIELQTQSFEFKNEPVSNILKTIQQTYGIVIIYDESILSNCPLTASLSDEPLYGKLDLLCLAIGADYQVIDGQIIINSKGCN